MEMAESSPIGKKMLWEKEKLLVKSNFSFSPSFFKRLMLQTSTNKGLFGEVNPKTLSKCQILDSFKLKEFAVDRFKFHGKAKCSPNR